MLARMTKLSSCPRCGSFLPHASRVCPGCAHTVARRTRLPGPVRTLLAIGGGGLLSVTLSACYGAPCAGGGCYDDYDPTTCTDPAEDLDGDGYCLEKDCDETDPFVHEGQGCSLPGDDGGLSDGGLADDAGFTDAGLTDAGLGDAGFTDAGLGDGGLGDGGELSDAGL